MSRKTKKTKRVNLTPDQLLQAEFDKSTALKFPALPRPVSGARRETLDDVNAFLSGSTVEEEARPAAGAGTGAAPVPAGDPPAADALLLTVADLCGLLQISRSTFFRLKKAGQVPGCITLGGQVRYHRETVEAWLRSQVKG
ncbi:helix-turn-helix transcriptional regulator [Geobacter pickeringii]|uniref:Helix-turn-helix domain-containing protein n=1 Tax=Geobacter pickeringii TaxID=345632 RepID=A0A0B5BFQ2_9BACT|nr:helix-turn-helix domain-containing protein [Geobacter pickeringii]AJE03335.1 hypothetical protein GPICK_08185 [Geobacter pickeringii]